MATLPVVSSIKRNNISSNMLIARMIRSRRSLAYNNSLSERNHLIIKNEDESANKNLLMLLGKDVYERYFYRIYRSLNDLEKSTLFNKYINILNSLSIDELKQLGEYEETQEEIILTQEQVNRNLLTDPYFIFYCKMGFIGFVGNFAILNHRVDYKLLPGQKYVFDLQDETNLGFQFSLSEDAFSYRDVENIHFIGTPGTPGAFVVYMPALSINFVSAFIYNKLDPSRKSYTVFASLVDTLVINITYKAPSVASSYQAKIEPNIQCLVEETDLRIVLNDGIKYVLEPPDFVYIGNMLERYTLSRQYGLYFGTYKINISSYSNPFTIINKGKENLIQVFGDESKKSVYYLKGLNDDINDTSLDGSYNFYYGDLFIDVIGDFESVALYSYKYGFNYMENFFIFSSTCTENAGVRTNYPDLSSGLIECLFPQSTYDFDVSNEIPFMTFNNNISKIAYNKDKVYGLFNGQYIIQNVPETNPIAFINAGKTDYFYYDGTETNKKVRLGPDNEVYDFYYGTIIVRVYGDFGKMSVYDFYYGYAGGYKLFQYSDVCDFNGTWTSDREVLTTPSSYDIIEYDVSGNFDLFKVDSYMSFDINSNNLYLDLSNTEITTNTKYSLNVGVYVLMEIPKRYAIAFLNKGLEEKFFYDGYIPYKIEGTGPDGFIYDFYYGNINIYISSDFGQISYYTINDGFLNGRKKMIFSSLANVGYAIPNNGSFNYFPQLSNTSYGDEPREFLLTVNIITIVLPYSGNITSYYFQGYDRNGVIDSNEPNPELTFFIGDTIIFGFQYVNSSFTLGIYFYNNLLNDPQLIKNNNNKVNETITWTPNLPLQNYYFYRSTNNSTFMFNAIQILPNASATLVPDISFTVPLSDSIISASPSEFVFETTMIMNVDTSKRLYIVNNTTGNTEYTLSNIQGTGTTSFTVYTGFDDYTRLSFSTNYSLVAEEGLLKNIYLNELVDLTLLTFTTEVIHDPQLLSIYPSQDTESTESTTTTYQMLSDTNTVSVESYNGQNVYIFNDISYQDNDYIGVEVGNYRITNIPESHPMAFIHENNVAMDYEPIDTGVIEIRVSGGDMSQNAYDDYYDFTDASGNVIGLSSSGPDPYRFMRGRTYRFSDYGVSISHPFKVFYNNGSTSTTPFSGGSNGSNYVDVTMAQNDTNTSYYRCHIHSTMAGNLEYFYSNINGVSYNFYYGDISLNISASFSALLGYYCYYHGYMGGEDRIKFTNPNISSSALDVSINPSDPVVLTFNEPVSFLSSSYNIQYYNTTNVTFSNYTSVESSGNDLYIYNTNLDYETYYRLLIDQNSIVDGSNILYDFTDSSLNSYYFFTGFDPRPKIVSTTPTFNQTDVSFDSDITILFNEEIYLGNTGNILIQNISDSVVFDAINISQDADVSNQLSGIGTNTLTILPFENFNIGTSYSVLIDNSVLQDISGNFFVGISDTSYFNFTIA